MGKLSSRNTLLASFAIALVVLGLFLAGMAPAARASSPQGQTHPVQLFYAIQHQGSTTAPPSSGSGDLRYGGGPVQHNPVAFVIFWGANWQGADSSRAQLLQTYFQSLGGTSFENILTQYSDTAGNIQNTESLGGVFFDPTTPPTDASCGTNTVHDSSFRSEVTHAIQVNGWPTELNATYFVYIPSGFPVNSDSFGCSTNAFCAYHNWSGSFSYGVMLFPNVAGCQVPSSPNGDVVADSEVNITTHEQFEAATDTQPPNGWTDASGEEIGDKCVGVYAGDPVNLNGHSFWVQNEYSNATHDCEISFGNVSPTPTTTRTPSPTGTPPPGVQPWSPNGVSYHVGDLVSFQGNVYSCVIAHTSQPGWDPVSAPALWQLVSGNVPTPTATPRPTNTPTPGPTGTPAPTNTPPPGVQPWSPNQVSYHVGDLVSFQGHVYRCLQAHTSEPGWDPVSAPALWQLVS
jgi:hypothetical protein